MPRFTLAILTCLATLPLWTPQADAQQQQQQQPAASPGAPELRAQVIPRDFTTLAAEVGARIASMPLHEGDHFAKGQLLVSFDCSTQRAQVDEAQADLRAASMTESTDQRLLALKSIGKLESAIAGAGVEKARARLDEVRTVFDKCTIKAPFNGRVVEQKARQDQFVQPGQPLVDILDDSVLELDFVAPSRWLTWLKLGYKFDVVLDENGTTYPVILSRIGARIDPVSQTIKMTGTIDGHHPELVAGMSGRIMLHPPAGQATASAPQ